MKKVNELTRQKSFAEIKKLILESFLETGNGVRPLPQILSFLAPRVPI